MNDRSLFYLFPAEDRIDVREMSERQAQRYLIKIVGTPRETEEEAIRHRADFRTMCPNCRTEHTAEELDSTTAHNKFVCKSCGEKFRIIHPDGSY